MDIFIKIIFLFLAVFIIAAFYWLFCKFFFWVAKSYQEGSVDKFRELKMFLFFVFSAVFAPETLRNLKELVLFVSGNF